MKIAFVVQRYGSDIVGGAEGLARQIAERIQALDSHCVHVYTTAARSYRTWANELPTGTSQENGVTIKRFGVRMARNKVLFGLINVLAKAIYEPCIKRFGLKVDWFEHLWLVLQGPWCPSLVRTLHEDSMSYDRIYFFTYLYYPTVLGLQRLRRPCTLIPSAHDEPALYFHTIRRAMSQAAHFYYNTEAEAQILRDVVPDFDKKSTRVAVGISTSAISEARSRPSSFDIPGPYILYLGRITAAKGVQELMDIFLKLTKSSRNTSVCLVLGGDLEDDFQIPCHPQIRFLGHIPEAEKYPLIQNSHALINPSPMESLSLVVIEAMACGVPIVANGKCSVFQSYAEELGSVLSYHSAQELSDWLASVMDPEGKESMRHAISQSQRWVESQFSWDSVLTAYCS